MTERKRITFVGRDSRELVFFYTTLVLCCLREYAELPEYWCNWNCANSTYWM